MTGGAEKSMIELLKKETQSNVKLLSFNSPNAFLAQDKKIIPVKGWELLFIDCTFSFKAFFYLEYAYAFVK